MRPRLATREAETRPKRRTERKRNEARKKEGMKRRGKMEGAGNARTRLTVDTFVPFQSKRGEGHGGDSESQL